MLPSIVFAPTLYFVLIHRQIVQGTIAYRTISLPKVILYLPPLSLQSGTLSLVSHRPLVTLKTRSPGQRNLYDVPSTLHRKNWRQSVGSRFRVSGSQSGTCNGFVVTANVRSIRNEKGNTFCHRENHYLFLYEQCQLKCSN